MPYCHGKHFRLLQRHKCCKTPLNGVNVTLQLRLPLLDQYQPMRKTVSTTGWKNHLLTITELVVRSGHCLEGQVIIQLHSTLTVNIFSTCITVSGLYSFVSTSSSKLTCVDLDQTRLVNRKIYLVSLYQKRNGWWTKKKRFSEICFPHPATIKTRWQASVHLGVGTWKRFSLSGFDDISRWRN